MKRFAFIVVLALVLGFSTSTNAELVDRGGGLIYDTDLNITWLQSPNNTAMTVADAKTWATNLSYYDSVRNQTLTGWRLPTSDQCQGYNCNSSEMGHLFYVELGNKASEAGGGLINKGPFPSLQPYFYWTDTNALYLGSGNYFVFSFDLGSQYGAVHNGTNFGGNGYYALAVRSGDVVNNPVPTISALNPIYALAGGGDFTLNVYGSSFIASSVVRWNGVNRTTTYISSAQLAARIPASEIAAAGTASVTVFNPAPGGGTSTAQTFTVSNPPTVSSLSPSSEWAGGGAFTLTVNGSNFIASSVVRWNGSNRTTTYVSSTQLAAAIPASDIAAPGTASVTVFNPTGGGTSTAQAFTLINPVPSVSSLSPSSATAGGGDFTLTINGSGFSASTVVYWNGVNRPTTYVSSTQLTARIPASDITAAGAPVVVVLNPPPGGGGYLPTFTINPVVSNPVPTVSSLSPSSATAGAGDFTLTINGSNFIASSVVRWNGSNRTTTYVSSTQLTARIPASDIAAAGTASVIVFNPTPGGGTSTARTFTINPVVSNPVPTVSSLSPSSATAGGGGFTLTINGSGFIASSVVYWNGVGRPTTYVSSTQLAALIPASDIAAAGTASVTVFSPAPGGGTSTAQTFRINPVVSNPVPTVSSLSPSSTTAGGGDFTLTINGSGFSASSVVYWNGVGRPTTYVSSTQLAARIPASDIAAAGTASVIVFNPTPGGGTSTAQTFRINPVVVNPVPTVSSLSPSSATAGGGDFTLTVNGSGFIASSVVYWNRVGRPTVYVSSAQLAARIPASDIAAAGTASVIVLNPAPGGGTSTALTFTINPAMTINPVPTVSSLSPSSNTAGAGAFTLAVTGSNFIYGSVVRWKGADRTTTYMSPSQLAARIPASDIATAGAASVTVFNPAPGGGTSYGMIFNIRW